MPLKITKDMSSHLIKYVRTVDIHFNREYGIIVWLYFILCMIQCIGLFLLWFFAGNNTMMVIGIFIIVSVEKITWRCLRF